MNHGPHRRKKFKVLYSLTWIQLLSRGISCRSREQLWSCPRPLVDCRRSFLPTTAPPLRHCKRNTSSEITDRINWARKDIQGGNITTELTKSNTWSESRCRIHFQQGGFWPRQRLRGGEGRRREGLIRDPWLQSRLSRIDHDHFDTENRKL